MTQLKQSKIPVAALIFILSAAAASHAQTAPKPATEATKAANRAVLSSLNFDDKSDFEDAARGFIAKPDTLTIKDANGRVVWDLESYKAFIDDAKQAPDSVEPVAHRPAQYEIRLVQSD
jgi:alkyl sulfatase BDS1-like metallo-beta-lactamase superfamily hydrolase